MQHRPTLPVIAATIAATAATLLLALAPALLSVPAEPRDALRLVHTVELPRVVVTGKRSAQVVELPRVVIAARREAAASVAAGAIGTAQPVMAPRGL